jgi:hypothetical protein
MPPLAQSYRCPTAIVFSAPLLRLSFSVDCAQNDRLDFSDSYAAAYPYWVRNSGNTFALSGNPSVSIQLKLFNFYDLSDDLQSAFSAVLTQQQLIGELPVEFAVNATLLHQLRDNSKQINYLAGGRMYAEAGMAALQSVDGLDDNSNSNAPYAGIFLDFQ